MPILLGVGAFVVTLGIISAVVGGSDKKTDAEVNSGVSATTPATSVATDEPQAVTDEPVEEPTEEPTTEAPPAVDKVTYVVRGSTADVTYGPAGSSLSGHVPLKVTKKLKSAAYYAISAQLQGGGHVTCEIEINGKVVSRAEAAGGYNIAMCEIIQDPLSDGWVDANMG